MSNLLDLLSPAARERFEDAIKHGPFKTSERFAEMGRTVAPGPLNRDQAAAAVIAIAFEANIDHQAAAVVIVTTCSS